MNKSTRISFIFILLFVVGVLVFVASINHSLNNPVVNPYSRDEPLPLS